MICLDYQIIYVSNIFKSHGIRIQNNRSTHAEMFSDNLYKQD